MRTKLYYLFLLFVMLVNLYPALELTRVIVLGGMKYYPFMINNFRLEIVTLWALYLSVIPIGLWGRNYIVKSDEVKKT